MNGHSINFCSQLFNFVSQTVTYWPSSSIICCCSVMSDCLQPHGLQHARFPCPPLSPGICSNSCPLSQWCHPTISSPVASFSSCCQSFPASGAFLVSQLFLSGGQNVGASATILPMNIQGWFPLGLTGLISLLSKELSRVFSSTTIWKHQFFGAQPSLWSNSHFHAWLLFLLFNMLSRFVMLFF